MIGAAPVNTSGHQFDSAPISMISVQEAVKKFETIQPSEYYGNSGGLWEVSANIRSRLNWTVVSGLIWTMNKGRRITMFVAIIICPPTVTHVMDIHDPAACCLVGTMSSVVVLKLWL